jgi:hypothetical protein
MVHVTDNTAAQQQKPILMRMTALAELQDCIALDDDTYEEEEKVKGYESNQLENVHLQHKSQVPGAISF